MGEQEKNLVFLKMQSTLEDSNPDISPTLREIESLNLFSQGNIYTTKIVRPAKQKHFIAPTILVGTLKPPKLLNIEFTGSVLPKYSESDKEKEIFACKYLQLEKASEVNTELISFNVVDFGARDECNSPKDIERKDKAYNPLHNICATSVKIDFTEDEQSEKEFYLKIYERFCSQLNSAAFDSTKYIPNVELKCLEKFQLDFVPYCLTHCDVSSSGNDHENILLLSGSDDLIHGYRRSYSFSTIDGDNEKGDDIDTNDKSDSSNLKTKNCFYEMEDNEIMQLFPEFSQSTPSPAMSLYFKYDECDQVSHRWSAIGCQDGQLQVFQVDSTKGEVLKVFEDLQFAGIGGIHHARFFNIPSEVTNESQLFNLIVVPSLERSALYIDITNSEKQLHLDKETQMLPMSSDFDSVNGCTILDIDGDGYPEIVLGTYGQELIVYKISENANDNKKLGSNTSHDLIPNWKVWMKKSFPYPILAVEGWERENSSIDSFGMDSAASILIVTTIRAIHILQYQKKSSN